MGRAAPLALFENLRLRRDPLPFFRHRTVIRADHDRLIHGAGGDGRVHRVCEQ